MGAFRPGTAFCIDGHHSIVIGIFSRRAAILDTCLHGIRPLCRYGVQLLGLCGV